jgi:hypothetical protein
LLQLVERNVAGGRKTLVWSNFVRNLETLERMLQRYRPALIHGGIPSEISDASASRTREAELARFRTDETCQVLLANPAATSEGVSLHDVCQDGSPARRPNPTSILPARSTIQTYSPP